MTDAVQKTVAVHTCRETDWEKEKAGGLLCREDRMQFSIEDESGIQEQFNLFEEARI